MSMECHLPSSAAHNMLLELWSLKAFLPIVLSKECAVNYKSFLNLLDCLNSRRRYRRNFGAPEHTLDIEYKERRMKSMGLTDRVKSICPHRSIFWQ